MLYGSNVYFDFDINILFVKHFLECEHVHSATKLVFYVLDFEFFRVDIWEILRLSVVIHAFNSIPHFIKVYNVYFNGIKYETCRDYEEWKNPIVLLCVRLSVIC